MSFSQGQPDRPNQPASGGEQPRRGPVRGKVTIRWSIRRVQPQTPPGSPPPPAPPPGVANRPSGGGDPRLNLLLTYGGWRESSWADCLPTLLEPMGVRSFRASSGAEASQILRTTPIHAAVVDLRLPLDRCASATRNEATPAAPAEEGGERLLEILRRLDSPPPTVVVTRDRTPRERMRELHHALRLGAYAVVLGNAADAEQMLRVLQRLVTRYYQDRWPGGSLPAASGEPAQ